MVHILYGPLTTHPVLNVLNTRVRIGSWSLQLNSTFVKLFLGNPKKYSNGYESNTIMVVILWPGNLKWNLKKTFCSKFQNCWEEKNPQPSWNLYTKYLLKYSILGNWVIKWLLIFVFDTAMIQIFGWITQNLFGKIVFQAHHRLCSIAMGPINYHLPSSATYKCVALVRAFTWIDHEQYKSRKYRERLQIATQRWVHALGLCKSR